MLTRNNKDDIKEFVLAGLQIRLAKYLRSAATDQFCGNDATNTAYAIQQIYMNLLDSNRRHFEETYKIAEATIDLEKLGNRLNRENDDRHYNLSELSERLGYSNALTWADYLYQEGKTNLEYYFEIPDISKIE